MNFDSHVDGVVAVASGLVNVATPGERQGRPYVLPRTAAALAPSLGDALRLGSRHADDPSTRRVALLVELADATRPVFEAAEVGGFDTAAALVNELLRRYVPTPTLEQHDGEPWHLHFHGPAAIDRSGWGGAVALGLATVLGSAHAERLGVCAAPVCDRVFVDVSRNGQRRFCSTACQNRVKASAHRARQRT